MRVTDKEYYMEDRLVAKCDTFIRRQKKKFDHFIILDGEEGYGKTTCATHLCYYLGYKTGKQFTTDNIFFDPDKLMAYAASTEKQIIMWDEAAFGGMGSQWQNKIQQKLIMCLMTARKKGHFWVFLIPEVNALKDYFIRRCCALIHIYSRDDEERGRYVYINKQKKNDIRNQIKKRKIISYKNYTFRGTFSDIISTLIDEEVYEKKKDKAIMEAFKDTEVSNPFKAKYEERMKQIGLLYAYMKENYNMSQGDIAKIINTNQKDISRCTLLGKQGLDLDSRQIIVT